MKFFSLFCLKFRQFCPILISQRLYLIDYLCYFLRLETFSGNGDGKNNFEQKRIIKSWLYFWIFIPENAINSIKEVSYRRFTILAFKCFIFCPLSSIEFLVYYNFYLRTLSSKRGSFSTLFARSWFEV